jgi:hypothetical protein
MFPLLKDGLGMQMMNTLGRGSGM